MNNDIIYEGIPIVPFERISKSNNRYYIIDNIEMPSVTTILKKLSQSGIDKWKARIGINEANIICNNAAERGTIVHEMCEKYLQSKTNLCVSLEDENCNNNNLINIGKHLNPDYIQKCKEQDLCTYFNNSFRPMLLNISNIKYQEVQLYSRKHVFAGTVDCIADYDNIPSIIDFKTSQKPKLKKYIDSYFLQTAAYSIAYEELTGICIENLVILIGIASTQKYQIFIENINNKWPMTGMSWKDSFIKLANDTNTTLK